MGYKKDIFAVLVVGFEPLRSFHLAFDQLLCYLKPAYKYHFDFIFGFDHYALDDLSDDLVIVLHRSVFQSVEDGINIIKSGFGIFSLLFCFGDL